MWKSKTIPLSEDKKCNALIQSTVVGDIRCANPKDSCILHTEAVTITCLSLNCPERVGGKCNADEKKKEDWEEVFEMFHKGDELGSAAWKVSPSTVRNFIKGLLEKV